MPITQEQYFKKPDESTEAYNLRVASLRNAANQEAKGGYASMTQEQKAELYPSAVISSANIEENVKPDLDEKVKTFSKTGSYVDDEGTERYADDTVKEEKDEDEAYLEALAAFNKKFGRKANDATGIKKVAGGGLDTTGAFDEEGNVIGGSRVPTAEEEEEEESDKEEQALIEKAREKLDADTKRMIDDIKTRYDLRRQQQAEINRRSEAAISNTLLMSGSSRYAQLSSTGVMRAKEMAGLREIMELDAEEKSLINQALQAQSEGEYKLLEKQLSLAEEKRKAKQAKAKELNDKIKEDNDKLKETKRTMDISAEISRLNNEGLTDTGDIFDQMKVGGFDATLEEIDKINKILNPSDEVKDALEGTSTDYKTYKSMLEAGEIPKDWDYFDFLDAKGNAERKATVTERTTELKTSAISKARPFLEQSTGEDGYIDPAVYMRLRGDYGEAIGDPSDFDDMFAPMLSPQERARLGLGKAVGLKAVDEEEDDDNPYGRKR